MNKIKFYRHSEDLTVKELSEKSGVAVAYISNLENDNQTNPSRETMIKIAAALGKTVPEVFFPDEDLKKVN